MPELDRRKVLACANQACGFRVSSDPALGGFCCRGCFTSLSCNGPPAHDEACEQISAAPFFPRAPCSAPSRPWRPVVPPVSQMSRAPPMTFQAARPRGAAGPLRPTPPIPRAVGSVGLSYPSRGPLRPRPPAYPPAPSAPSASTAPAAAWGAPRIPRAGPPRIPRAGPGLGSVYQRTRVAAECAGAKRLLPQQMEAQKRPRASFWQTDAAAKACDTYDVEEIETCADEPMSGELLVFNLHKTIPRAAPGVYEEDDEPLLDETPDFAGPRPGGHRRSVEETKPTNPAGSRHGDGSKPCDPAHFAALREAAETRAEQRLAMGEATLADLKFAARKRGQGKAGFAFAEGLAEDFLVCHLCLQVHGAICNPDVVDAQPPAGSRRPPLLRSFAEE